MPLLGPCFPASNLTHAHGSPWLRLTCCLAAALLVGCEKAKPTATTVPTAAASVDETQIAEATNVDENAPAASTAESDSSKALRHAVFFSFKEEATEEDIQGVADAFTALPSKIDVITDFKWGTNNSPEGLDDGFTQVTFDSEEGREEYLPHPDHKAFVEVLKPVLDKVRVLDFWEQ